jgi:hypothetical protein
MNKVSKVVTNIVNDNKVKSKTAMSIIGTPKKAKKPMPVKVPKMEMGIKSKLLDMPTKGGKKM